MHLGLIVNWCSFDFWQLLKFWCILHQTFYESPRRIDIWIRGSPIIETHLCCWTFSENCGISCQSFLEILQTSEKHWHPLQHFWRIADLVVNPTNLQESLVWNASILKLALQNWRKLFKTEKPEAVPIQTEINPFKPNTNMKISSDNSFKKTTGPLDLSRGQDLMRTAEGMWRRRTPGPGRRTYLVHLPRI
jgi:hypothetical protein